MTRVWRSGWIAAPGSSGAAAFHRDLFSRAILLAFIAGTTVPPSALSQVYGSANQTVGVQVAPITVLAVQGGAVTLNITNANVTAGVDEMVVQDQNARLVWGTNSSDRKITAHSSLAASVFRLELVALNPTRGSPGAQMILDASPKDLVLNVGRSLGSCTLKYTGTALASQGVGTDVHTITFTVTAQ